MAVTGQKIPVAKRKRIFGSKCFQLFRRILFRIYTERHNPHVQILSLQFFCSSVMWAVIGGQTVLQFVNIKSAIQTCPFRLFSDTVFHLGFDMKTVQSDSSAGLLSFSPAGAQERQTKTAAKIFIFSFPFPMDKTLTAFIIKNSRTLPYQKEGAKEYAPLCVMF